MDWLRFRTRLDARQRRELLALGWRLMQRIPGHSTTICGLAGPPGSGKSTLAGLVVSLSNASGVPALSLSLDDYYLSRSARVKKARAHHPLFTVRGVPGTHDWRMLRCHLGALCCNAFEPVSLPIFDKARDEPAPRSEWRRVTAPPRRVLLEGWCVGAPPQSKDQLARAVNELERTEDGELRWRTEVNRELMRYESELWGRLDQRWYLMAPGWSQVVAWRWQQEQELPHRHLQNEAAVAQFLATFERLVRHMDASEHEWSNLTLYLDAHHRFHDKPRAVE